MNNTRPLLTRTLRGNSGRDTLEPETRGLAGVGMRAEHTELWLAGSECLDGLRYVEFISENHIARGGRPSRVASALAENHKVLLHGVSLSIGGTDDLNVEHLRGLRALADSLDAEVVSDHLCFGGFEGHYGHDLWPLPRTQECLEHLVSRVHYAQELLGRPLALENPSSYIDFVHVDMSEPALLNELCARTGCSILLDVNNVYVSARNMGWSPEEYILALHPSHVAQYHLAGHSDRGGYLFDDHAHAVPESVWTLYDVALKHVGPRPLVIERDENVPDLETLCAEARRADLAPSVSRLDGGYEVHDASVC